jgi:hypothetical protein
MSERTKGPWMVDCDYLECVTDATGYEIVECNHSDNDQAFADAAAIVRWENSYDDLVAALENVRAIIAEGAMTGFIYKDGDWAERLFASQQITSAALAKAKPCPRK